MRASETPPHVLQIARACIVVLLAASLSGCVSDSVFYRIETGEEFQGTIEVPSVKVEARGKITIETHGAGLYLTEPDATPPPDEESAPE